MSDLSHGSPPFNRVPPRIRDSRGGPAPELIRRTLLPQMDYEVWPRPGTANDNQISRDKGPWLPVDNLRGAASGWYDWTGAGPTRPEIHQRNITLRIMQGNSRTRALPNPIDPTVGLHSDPKVPASGTVQRFTNANNPRLRPGRQDRLSNSQYSGQSYSATTRMQGA